jgi:5-formyltetrahydrofolate cyclo-ligase
LNQPRSKATERVLLRARRDGISTAEVDAMSSMITKSVIDNGLFEGANLVGSYHSIGSEIRTQELHEQLERLGVEVALPRVCDDRIEFVQVNKTTPMHRSALGVEEPAGDAIEVSEIDLIIVPGIAFDRRGFRLGYGKGFYDRFLADVSALKVGLCAEALLVDALPIDEHDQRVDRVFTEQHRWNVA